MNHENKTPASQEPSPAGYAKRELEMLIGFREAVRRIASNPIDSSDMMDEIDHLLSLPTP